MIKSTKYHGPSDVRYCIIIKLFSISCPVFSYPPRLKLTIAAAEALLINCLINYYNR
jgi:hypothetical protein